MGEYSVKHQCDKVCVDCWYYYVDTHSGVEMCWAGHDDRVGRHVLACGDYKEED